MSEIAPVLASLVFFLAIGWIVRIVSDNRRRLALARTQAELHTRILEKLGTAEEALRYLDSEAGRGLLDAAVQVRANPLQRILGSVHAGILLSAVGLGLLLLLGFVQSEAREGFLILGTLTVGLGTGFLVSAVASWLLSRRFGLLDTGADAGR